MKQTLVAVVTLQYFCGSGYAISNVEAQRGTKGYNNDDNLHFSKKIIRLQKLEILSNITNIYLLLWKC